MFEFKVIKDYMELHTEGITFIGHDGMPCVLDTKNLKIKIFLTKDPILSYVERRKVIYAMREEPIYYA
jgi:hypothetical protein